MRLSGIRRLLVTRGVHFLATRFGPRRLRSLAFDEKYRRGDWRFQGQGEDELAQVVRRYLRHGDLLVLGCGSASVLEGLEASGISSVLGIDLSREAIRLASRYASDTVAFQVGDMERFEWRREYDAVLFSESIYYVPSGRRIPMLTRLTSALKPGGVFVVTLAEPRRYKDIVGRIHEAFAVVEERLLKDSGQYLVVFRPHNDAGASGSGVRQEGTGRSETRWH